MKDIMNKEITVGSRVIFDVDRKEKQVVGTVRHFDSVLVDIVYTDKNGLTVRITKNPKHIAVLD